ncbi:MAG: Hpt domain-containing protein [Bdellovibrionota bacterium]
MSLQDLLAGLQKTYLASMPEKIARIETLFSAKSFDELESEYHKLKGTGRTYGIPEVTQLGAAMERLCDTHAEHLGQMVPVSVQLIKAITESRIAGNAFDLDSNADFKKIIDLIE